jgi:UDP:flavonoid glycosyltransferase YjiC (YdhE family)
VRVLMTTVPGSAFYLPMVPLAWALRTAGHDVLMVNNGKAAEVTAGAGVPVVDPCPESDAWAEFLEVLSASRASAYAAGTKALVRPAEADKRAELIQMIGGRFALFGRRMGPGTLRIARAYRPDLVISTVEQWSGSMVAGELGLPYVELSVRFSHDRFDLSGDQLRTAIATAAGPGTPAQPDVTIDFRPPSIGASETDKQWLTRYVPYNGSTVLPEWAITEPERPRVCLTLGSVMPALGGVARVRELLSWLGALDVEVVLALGDVDHSDLGELPANVRAVGWMPLNALLPHCAAIVHHGGAGTCLTAMVCGVPQVVLPRFADQPENAAIVADRGLGIALPPAQATPDAIRAALDRVLTEPEFRKASAEVSAEIAEQPGPAVLVSRLETLARDAQLPRDVGDPAC